MLNRRYFFTAGVASGALAMTGARARLAFAALPDDRRFVVVILRGALDGLAAVPAHGDPDYATVRGNLALPANGPGAPIDLDGFFGLHPSLHDLADLFHANELAIFHNASTPYRDRSHFEAQNVLETGATTPHLLNDGWLNRALAPLALDTGTGALAVSSSPPLLLDGPARVTSWLPSKKPVPDEEFLTRVGALYENDAVLRDGLRQALQTRAASEGAMHGSGPQQTLAARNGVAGGIAALTEGAGKILAASSGPRVGVFDISGWDTHFNQGGADGQLARRLQALDEGIAGLKQSLGDAWKKTVIVAASEFGRTVHVNGTGGTDHGTAGVVFVMGGAVAGGTVHAEWSGLKAAALRDGRDLPPRTDTRTIFKTLLADHLGVPKSILDDKIFPDSGSDKIIAGLIRA
jgi:uncharacterized protein (DUF1501 family)